MVSDCEPPQDRLLARAFDRDQGEVRRAAADVADQHQPNAGQLLRERAAVDAREVVEGGLRFLEQRRPRQPRFRGGPQRERPRTLVE